MYNLLTGNSSVSLSSPPLSKRGRSGMTSSERKRRRSNAEILMTKKHEDDVSRWSSKRSRRSERSQDENSITSSSTLNTAFIYMDDNTADLRYMNDYAHVMNIKI